MLASSISVAESIRQALDADAADEEVRESLEELARREAIAACCPAYGPALYKRNRPLFRRFLLEQLDAITFGASAQVREVWGGTRGEEMQSWLDCADDADDVEVFRRLYLWRAAALSIRERERRWRADLLRRFTEAPDSASRATVLSKMVSFLTLDEPTATALYERDPAVAADFVLFHLPSASLRARRAPTFFWADLSSRVRQDGNQDLFFAIYRRTVEDDQWARDIETLGARLEDPGRLDEELMRRQPDRPRAVAATVLGALLRARGADVMPFALRATALLGASVESEPSRCRDLIRLADDRGWLTLWSALLGAMGGHDDVDREVRRLAEDRKRADDEILSRLVLLVGVGDAPGSVRVSPPPALSDDTLVRLYARFPGLVRGPYGSCVQFGPRGGYARLVAAAIEAEDEVMIDTLASLAVRLDLRWEWARREASSSVEALHGHYVAFVGDDFRSAARMAAVLGKLQPGTTGSWRTIAKLNALARLFWGRLFSSCLVNPEALRSLLESGEVLAQVVAWRALGLDDPRGRAFAASNLDALLPALLRPMPRSSRLVAFGALANAAHTTETAGRVVDAVRAAAVLPDRAYPKDDLFALLAGVLRRWPQLRSAAERTVPRGSGAR